MLITSIIGLFGCINPAKWNNEKTDKWFEKGEWLNGWTVKPDNSINRKALAAAYFKNKERWNSAFRFLKTNDLSKLEIKRHDIDGDNLFVNVNEYNTKNEQDAKFEAHRKYIDIQYVVKGEELIGVAPLASRDSVLKGYDDKNDVELLKVDKKMFYQASPENFFIFFPEDAHMPGLKVDAIAPVRKVVVKLRID